MQNIYPVLKTMQEVGMLLLVHGEVTHHDVDIFDREKEFLDNVLAPIVNDFPDLKIVLSILPPPMPQLLYKQRKCCATITAHHLFTTAIICLSVALNLISIAFQF